ncbi:MAG: hypothetical protein CUN55_08680 [Phototrophicales bacterium]|nr:MAG: hypothetical protein CUN55_08680 [Phototrophicales bacterium]
MKRVLLVAVLMLLGSVACYSDSPLWVFGVTDTPPTATFLPTPDYDKYPAKLGQDQVALAPIPSGGPTQPFFFVTRLPEELISGLRNASGSCDYGSELEVLYIGHKWESFSGTVFIDDIVLTSAENTETVFDFETPVDWAAEDDGIGADDEKAQIRNNVDFNSLKLSNSDVDVSNSTSVLGLDIQFSGEDWEASFATKFEPPQDWSTFDAISFNVFTPSNASKFYAIPFIRTANSEQAFASDKIALNSGLWTEVSFDLSAIEDRSNIQAFGVKIGANPTNTYYLVACSGTVGWANETRIAGPVLFLKGQSAQTRPISERGAPIPEGQPFMIHGGAEPPIGPLPASNQCQVGEVVDIIGVSSTNQQIWYNIRCDGTEGWVTEDRLFGPLFLPAVNGIGVVVAEEGITEIPLTANAGEVSDDNPPIGTCPINTAITTLDFETILVGEEQVPYYLISCGDLVGWTTQDPLLEIPYPLSTYVIVIGPEGSDEILVEAESEGNAETTDEISDTPVEDVALQDEQSFIDPRYRPATLTSEPAPATEDNIIGECPSSTVVQLEDVASNFGLIYYQVTCGEVTGWIDARNLPNSVLYPPGQTIWFTQPTFDAQRRRQRGFAIDATPSQTSPEIGQCALFQPVEVLRVIFEQRALKRLGFRLYYEVSCTNLDGEPIVGWQELELHTDKIATQNPLQIFGS